MHTNLKILETMLMTWSDEEVSAAWSMVAAEGKRRRTQRTTALKEVLCVGDTVEWEGRNGTVRGIVEKVMTKNARVVVGGSTWKVPMSFLRKV